MKLYNFDPSSLFFSLGPNELSFMDYVKEGWRREQVEDSMDSVPRDWLKTGDSGWNFVFQIFSQFSQNFFSREKLTRIWKLSNWQNSKSWMITLKNCHVPNGYRTRAIITRFWKLYIHTLESGINVHPWINVAPWKICQKE